MRKRFLLTLLLPLFPAFWASAQIDSNSDPVTYKIESIEVEGCEFTRPVSVKRHSGLREGEEVTIPGTDIPDAIKALWDQKVFADVRIEAPQIVGNSIYLLIKVTERPRVAGFSVDGKGVTKSQVDDLREQILFVRNTMWTPEKRTRAERKIRNYYMEKGYFNTTVDFETEPDQYVKNAIRIKVHVDKGNRIKISDIKIDGNQDFSDKRLVRKLKDLKEKRWYRLWARSKYIPKLMESSKDNLINFYRQNGYRDAEVVTDTVLGVDDKLVDVELKVYEGNQYYIRDISFSGNYKYDDDSLRQVLGIERGDIYDSEKLDRRLHGDMTSVDVSGLYLDDGYLFFNAEPVEVRVDNDSVDLEVRIFEGPQATIRNIIVEGNTKTSDYVILRELRTLPGQKFSRADLIRSQREILNLGYFNQENLQVVPIPDPVKGTVDIKYVVEEKPSDQLQLQGGWGGRITDTQGNVIGGGFVGTLSVGFNNFSTKKFFKKKAWNPIPSGDGQKLSLAVQVNGVGWQNYSISFLEPWLGGKKPNSLGSSLYYTINQNPRTGFSMKTFGTGLDYGVRMKVPDDYFKSYTSLGYKYYDIRNGSTAFTSLDFDDAFINIISLRQTIDRTSIDAPIFPRSGSQISLSVEATPPYSLFKKDADYATLDDATKFKFLEYYKIKFSSVWYHNIVQNLVIKPRIEFGYLGSYNKDYGISPFERFYLGGSGLGQFNFYGWEYIGLRGYPDNSIGPREEGASESTLPLGGNIYSKYSLELRYPLTLNQAAPIWMVGFLEAGNAWMGFENFNPFELKRTAGVGLRVMLPMVGLLGVDWGYGFDKITRNSAAPNGSQFTFIIGQEF